MTRLCVPIFVRNADQARRDALVAVELGADMIELRLDAALDVDLLDTTVEGVAWKRDMLVSELQQLVHDLAVPVLLTCRPASEGGLTEADDEARLTLLAAVAHDVACYVDLEWRTLHHAGGWPWAFLKLSGQRAEPTRIILSAHDFEDRPPNLISLFADMSESRGDIVKLAWRARSVRDNIEAFELLRDAAKPTIAVCMGEDGLPSRVLAKKFNAFLGFASLSLTRGTADGQVPVDVMKRLYRWDAISRTTRVYGVVGHPVAHSLSPHVHNRAFDEAGVDGVYLPLPVQPGYESFKAFMESFLEFEPLDLSGLSITLPHKQNALRYLRETGGIIDSLAGRIGAVNTIIIGREDGTRTLRGTNTDAYAIVTTLAETLDCAPRDLAGRAVAVIGAGGTGRTSVAALAGLGCRVTVYNRTLSRAHDLVNEFNDEATSHGGSVRAASLDDLSHARADIFLQTTSIGMHPNVAASAFGDSLPVMSSGTVVFDVIYNPRKTRLLGQAEAAGARIVNGEQMFLNQAAAQFHAWTGRDAPLEAMRKAFRAGLEVGEI